METSNLFPEDQDNGITGAEGAQDIEQGIGQLEEDAGDQSDYPEMDDLDDTSESTETGGQSENAYGQAEPDEDSMVDENDPDVNSNGGYGGFSGVPGVTNNTYLHLPTETNVISPKWQN